MYSFERFVARGNIKLEKFFKEVGVNSDEELREYCIRKNLTIPKACYFPEPEVVSKEEDNVPEPQIEEKPEVSKKVENVESSSGKEDEEKPAKKRASKPKTTRRRTRKKTET